MPYPVFEEDGMMMIPRKWGQGQLFAFSALDGASYASDDLTGMLCGDRIGVRFFSNVKRELAMVNVWGKNLEFDAVTSDYIRFAFPEQPDGKIRTGYPTYGISFRGANRSQFFQKRMPLDKRTQYYGRYP